MSSHMSDDAAAASAQAEAASDSTAAAAAAGEQQPQQLLLDALPYVDAHDPAMKEQVDLLVREGQSMQGHRTRMQRLRMGSTGGKAARSPTRIQPVHLACADSGAVLCAVLVVCACRTAQKC
jgi:hypothetical protein